MIAKRKNEHTKASKVTQVRMTLKDQLILRSVSTAENLSRTSLLLKLIHQHANAIRRGDEGIEKRIKMMTEDVKELNRQIEKLGNLDELTEQVERIGAAVEYIVSNLDNLPDEDTMNMVDNHVVCLRALSKLDIPSEEEMERVSTHLAELERIEKLS